MHAVDRVRSFNRFYTRLIGLLDEDLDGTGFTLTEARVLFELAHRRTCTAADLVATLGIDGGYLSRLLARFEREGWVQRTPLPQDRRSSVLQLTPAGRATFRPLREAARRNVGALLDPIDPGGQNELLRSLTTVRALLGDEETIGSEILLRGLRAGDVGWIVHRQGELYHREHGWDATYEALVARILADFTDGLDPAHDQAWVAEQAGRIVGSVFLVRSGEDGVGQLRLLYVEPSTRGHGLGRRLVDACIDGASERGYRVLRLWTNDVLAAARHIYETAGFEITASERHHSFGHDLVGQTWELALPSEVLAKEGPGRQSPHHGNPDGRPHQVGPSQR